MRILSYTSWLIKLCLIIGCFGFINTSQSLAQSNCVNVLLTVERNVTLDGGSNGKIRAQCVGNCSCPQGYLYSLNGGEFTTKTVYENLPSGDYRVTILDMCRGCTSSSSTVSLRAPNPCVTVSGFTFRNVTNNGGNDGQINASCNGACFSCSAGYKYSLNGGMEQSSPVFSNLRAGTYRIQIRDICSGCTNTSDIITVTQPIGQTQCAGVNLNVQRNVTVKGGSDGIVNANCIGICTNCHLGFEYSLNGGSFQANSQFRDLRAGTYNVTIRNVCTGCISVSNSVVITEPNNCAQAFASVSRNVSFQAGNDGSITAGCIGICNCSQGYQYALGNGTFQSNPNFNNLKAGTYTITLRDNCTGCTSISNSVVITEPSANPCVGVTANVTQNVTMQGMTNGIIQANCSGTCNDCAAGYQYAINNGLFQNSPVFSNLSAGVYTVKIKNRCNGCISISPAVSVTEPVKCVGVSLRVLNDASEGLRNGRIQASCLGNCGICNIGYEFSLNNGGFQLSSTFPNLSAGTYFVTIRDRCSGCTSTSEPVVIRQPSSNQCANVGASITRNISVTNAADGEITANCFGDCNSCVTGFEYAINGGAFQMSPVFKNLRAGAHIITLRNKCNNCINFSNQVTLINPAPVSCVGVDAVVSANNATRGGATGQITAQCTGFSCGTCSIGYAYSINNGPVQTSNIFNGLRAGSYVITIKDNCTGCISNSRTLVVTEPSEVNCASLKVIDVRNVSAPFGVDGAITVACDGINCNSCNAGFEYALDNRPFQRGTNFGGLRAGTYIVKIRNICTGCISMTAPITIIEPFSAPCPVVGASVTQMVSKVGGMDGVIQAGCTGVCNCSLGYQYSLNGGAFQNSNVFTGLKEGKYVVTMRNNCTNCPISSTEEITVGLNQNFPCEMRPSIVSIKVNSNTSTTLKWSETPGVLWYALEYKDEDADDFRVIKYIYDTQYTLMNLQGGVNYIVRLRAFCIEGLISDYSPEGVFTSKKEVGSCVSPAFSATILSGDQVRLDWAPVLNAKCYIVSYRQDGEQEWTELLLPTNVRSYFMNGLEIGVGYQVRMRTNCTSCELLTGNFSMYSNVLAIGLRMEENKTKQTSFSLYPNPANDVFTVNCENDVNNFTLVVYTLSGQEVISQKLSFGENHISTSDLTSGVYICKFKLGNTIISNQKLVIVK